MRWHARRKVGQHGGTTRRQPVGVAGAWREPCPIGPRGRPSRAPGVDFGGPLMVFGAQSQWRDARGIAIRRRRGEYETRIEGAARVHRRAPDSSRGPPAAIHRRGCCPSARRSPQVGDVGWDSAPPQARRKQQRSRPGSGRSTARRPSARRFRPTFGSRAQTARRFPLRRCAQDVCMGDDVTLASRHFLGGRDGGARTLGSCADRARPSRENHARHIVLRHSNPPTRRSAIAETVKPSGRTS